MQRRQCVDSFKNRRGESDLGINCLVLNHAALQRFGFFDKNSRELIRVGRKIQPASCGRHNSSHPVDIELRVWIDSDNRNANLGFDELRNQGGRRQRRVAVGNNNHVLGGGVGVCELPRLYSNDRVAEDSLESPRGLVSAPQDSPCRPLPAPPRYTAATLRP